VLITGDALVTSNIYTGEVRARVMPAEFNHDQALAIRSLSRLASLKANVVLTGHGPPFEGNPMKAVEEATGRL
jgi:glyoxylase-like metal-dependent hydrolase (beta-lactamase superfamily II)